MGSVRHSSVGEDSTHALIVPDDVSPAHGVWDMLHQCFYLCTQIGLLFSLILLYPYTPCLLNKTVGGWIFQPFHLLEMNVASESTLFSLSGYSQVPRGLAFFWGGGGQH